MRLSNMVGSAGSAGQSTDRPDALGSTLDNLQQSFNFGLLHRDHFPLLADQLVQTLNRGQGNSVSVNGRNPGIVVPEAK